VSGDAAHRLLDQIKEVKDVRSTAARLSAILHLLLFVLMERLFWLPVFMYIDSEGQHALSEVLGENIHPPSFCNTRQNPRHQYQRSLILQEQPLSQYVTGPRLCRWCMFSYKQRVKLL
jgi:hypothetical protein